MKNKTIGRPPKEGSQKWIEVNGVNASNKSSKRTSKKVSKEKKPSKIKLVATSNDILKKKSNKRKREEESDEYDSVSFNLI
jgi:hypothetical protein